MGKRLTLLVLALGLCLPLAARAANIIWVAEANLTPAGLPYDQGWIDLLRAQGHTVDDQRGNWMTLDAAKLATLEVADLIIVSRTSNSGNYATDAGEVTQWNSLSTPVILMTAFIARNSRWQWINSNSQNELAPESMLQVAKTDHPIFTGVTLADGRVDMIDAAVDSGQNSFILATDVGNGTLIGTRATDGNIWIAEWAPGVTFYSGTTQQPAGKRLFLTGGGGGAQTAGSMNFTAVGQKIFLNAVRYMLGEPVELGLATQPAPANDATDVPRDAVLSWTAGEFAQTHNVYLGLSPDDVNNATVANPLGVLVSQGKNATSYTVADLEFGRTYYWRVDEVNAPPDSTVVKGRLWSFTVEPLAYAIENVTATASSAQPGMGPENTVNGSGLDQSDQHSTEPKEMWISAGVQPNWIQFAFDKTYKLHELWVWNSNQVIESFVGFGAKSVKVEYSADGTTWTELPEVPEFARAPGLPTYAHDTTVNLGGVLAQHVKLTVNSTWGGLPQGGLAEVRFSYIPVQARGPQPAAGATGVDLDVTLDWRPGREAASHKVYFGTDKDAAANGTAPAVTLTDHSYTPASLQFGTTYYWRVDEIGAAATPGTEVGEVWSFTAKEYAVVEGFETYTDDEGNRIYETWIDGWSNKTGSVVGNLTAPFAERAIVHTGKQAMPMDYNNVKAPFYSEAERTWDTTQDWTLSGATGLSLWFRGNATNGVQPLYVMVRDSANKSQMVSHPDPAAMTATSWQQWRIPFTDLAGVNMARVKTLYIGVGDPGSPKSGGAGRLYLDDIGFGRPAATK